MEFTAVFLIFTYVHQPQSDEEELWRPTKNMLILDNWIRSSSTEWDHHDL